MTTDLASTTARHCIVDSPLGPLTLVRDDAGYTGLYFPGHWTRPDRDTFGSQADPRDPYFAEAITQLAQYFTGERPTFDLPLNDTGDDTQRRLRALLGTIGYGHTTTYGALAAQLGSGLTARDVGKLVGQNPLSILVPCHRVVGANGALTGYAGGLTRKRYLLELEGALPRPLGWPAIITQ